MIARPNTIVWRRPRRRQTLSVALWLSITMLAYRLSLWFDGR